MAEIESEGMNLKIERVVHFDWGSKKNKRAMCVANLRDDLWCVDSISIAGNSATLLQDACRNVPPGSKTLIGFDFAIGLPVGYMKQAKLKTFLEAIDVFGDEPWQEFFEKAYHPTEVGIHRPFYPRKSTPKGYTSRSILTDRLGITWEHVFRKCERKTSYRSAASPIFWTLGAKQVGTATMLGWKEVLQPLIRDSSRCIGLWPFEGDLEEILQVKDAAVVETYPNEAYSHLGFPKKWTGKTSHHARKCVSKIILDWGLRSSVKWSEKVLDQIESGFGEENDGEDPFDALVGACSMIAVIIGQRPVSSSLDEDSKLREGWIFGQNADVFGQEK